MLTTEEINEILNNILIQLNEKDPYKYYGVFCSRYQQSGARKPNKIDVVAFKFPTFEEMCSDEGIYVENQTFIDDNLVHILDMRVYFVEKPTGALYVINPLYPKVEHTKEEVIKLFKAYLNTKQKSKKDIYSTLTPTERLGLKGIYDTIGLEGEISISKLIQTTQVSRITFNNLLNALATQGCAEVVSRGVRGTYIRIIDPVLISYLVQSKEN